MTNPTNESAFYKAMQEKKRQMSSQLSSLSKVMDMMVQTETHSINSVPLSCKKKSQQNATMISLPSFDPVCKFDQIQFHSGEQVEVEEESEEESLEMLSTRSSASAKKVSVLKPIIEEHVPTVSFSKEEYKQVFKRCHKSLRKAKIGVDSIGDFYKSKKVLNNLLNQIIVDKYMAKRSSWLWLLILNI